MLLVLHYSVNSVHELLGLLLFGILVLQAFILSRNFLTFNWFTKSSVILGNDRAGGLDLSTELLVVTHFVNVDHLISDNIRNILSLAHVLVLASRSISFVSITLHIASLGLSSFVFWLDKVALAHYSVSSC